MSALSELSVASFAGLAINRYAIHLRASEAAQLPAFPGSALRGAFGHALKRAVCVMPHRDCARCLVASRCLYPYIFETPWPAAGAERHREQQNAPHPYLLDPPVYCVRRVRNEEPENEEGVNRRGKWAREITLAPDDEIVFGLTLFGQAIEQLPFLLYAVHELAEQGLSVRRHHFTLAQVDCVESDGRRATIYTGATQQLAQTTQAPPRLSELIAARLSALSLPPDARLRLRFVTPLRIRVRDDLQARLSFELLARNLLRRVSLLMEAHGGGPLALDYRGLLARTAQVQVLDSRLRWWDLGRWSNRQQTRMKLGGMMGEVEFGAGWEEFLPLIVAGEFLRVGNGTSFGLGKYEIETDAESYESN